MAKNMKNITAEQEEPAGASLKARRAGCYVFLILISFICLFWFYVLFINATRSNSQLARGFTALPSVNLEQICITCSAERFRLFPVCAILL